MERNQMTRRSFVKTSAGMAAVAAAPIFIPAKVFGANDTIRVAVLGVNGRGKNHIEEFEKLKKVQVVALCDPDLSVLQECADAYGKRFNKTYRIVQDLRRIFDDREIDAVSIATPNHWHALAAIWACQAGKDVYVEKPASHNIYEGRKLVEAAVKYDRIVQNGVQLRSSKAIREAVELLHNGIIGRVYMARGVVFRWRPSIGRKGFEPAPDTLDYDLWLGPAPYRPFSRDWVHYNWHWQWDFGNGDIGNQGIHETDLCLWGLDVGLPRRITALGGKFLWDDSKEVPEVLTALFHYPEEKKMIQFEVRPWCTNTEDGVKVGNIFYGEKGFMKIYGYEKYETWLMTGPEKYEKGPSGEAGGDHFANFIDAVRAHDKRLLNGPVETAHLSSALAHLANISFRLGRLLEFDADSETFVNDPEANAMLSRTYRAPYVVPQKV